MASNQVDLVATHNQDFKGEKNSCSIRLKFTMSSKKYAFYEYFEDWAKEVSISDGTIRGEDLKFSGRKILMALSED